MIVAAEIFRQDKYNIAITFHNDGELRYSIHPHNESKWESCLPITDDTDPTIIALSYIVVENFYQQIDNPTKRSNTAKIPQSPAQPIENLDDLIKEMET